MSFYISKSFFFVPMGEDDSIAEDINETLAQIEMKQTEMFELLREKRAGGVSDQEYNERGALIEKAIQELTERRVNLESK